MNEEKATITQSPLPRKNEKQTPITMNFYEALQEVTKNKKIHKLEWEDLQYYGLLKDNVLTLHKPDDKFYQWVINDGDMNGIDWIIIEEKEEKLED